MIPLPYFEDISSIYLDYITNTLYPNIKKNKILVYTFATLHVLGAVMIAIGPYFPPDYQPFVLIYLILVALSYSFFEGHCFMTLFTNKYSGIKETALHIRMGTAKKILIFNIGLSLIAILYPKYSMFKLLQRFFSD